MGTYTTLDDPSSGGRIGDPDQVGTIGCGINDSGAVVGYYSESSGLYEGFLYSDGTYTTLNDPMAVTGTLSPNSISNNGEVVGGYEDSSGIYQGFAETGGNYTTISDPLGVKGTWATGVNDSGDVVGTYRDGAGAVHSFVEEGGLYTTYADPRAGPHRATVVTGINDSGEIVGNYTNHAGVRQGFIEETNGRFYNIADPRGREGATRVLGVNDKGEVVGDYRNKYGLHGFVEFHGNYHTDDDPLGFSRYPGPRDDYTIAAGINDEGEITGSYGIEADTGYFYLSGFVCEK